MTTIEKIRAEIRNNRDEWIKGQDAEWHTYDRCLAIIDKYAEQEPCDKCVYSTKDGYCQYDDISETIPPLEPCDDAEQTEKNCDTCINKDKCSPNIREIVRKNGCPKWTPKQTEQQNCEDKDIYELLLPMGKYLKTSFPCDAEDDVKQTKQEPCDDVVSRDMALEKMADYAASGYADSADDFEEYSRIICQLPSVTKKPIECDDAVSRQAVKDLFCRICMENNICYRSKDTCEDLKLFNQLPSVRPQEPKTGRWIEHPHEAGVNWEYSRYECSECHAWSDDDSYFCPNCGAKMVKLQERSE